jgi:hypothetical protein
MARQILLHMLPQDWNSFLRTIQERDPVTVVVRDSDSSEVNPGEGFEGDAVDATVCLWNRDLLPRLKREWVSESGYFRIDTLNLPVLEFTPSFNASWEGKPALGQGRLFGDFDPHLGKTEGFVKWYESLSRWIRANFKKNPVGIGGYLGPAAFHFYESGGYLLPNFVPPPTKEWRALIGKEHI